MTNKLKTKKTFTSYILIASLLVIALLFSGCMTTPIGDVTIEDNIGKSVTVSGTVDNTVKIGDLSGYTLKDDTGTIRISSESLPQEGTKKTVSGTLMKDSLFGYYIKVG